MSCRSVGQSAILELIVSTRAVTLTLILSEKVKKMLLQSPKPKMMSYIVCLF